MFKFNAAKCKNKITRSSPVIDYNYILFRKPCLLIFSSWRKQRELLTFFFSFKLLNKKQYAENVKKKDILLSMIEKKVYEKFFTKWLQVGLCYGAGNLLH